MELPNYFLADLPEAALDPTIVAEACQTLKRNRERYLQPRSTASLIAVISETAAEWLKPDFPFRQAALRDGPSPTGFSAATLARGLDDFFRQITAANLEALVRQDLGQLPRLDRMAPLEAQPRTLALARGPEFLVHITAGNIPLPAITSMILGLLVRAAQFVKCATGASLVPRLFAHSLYEADRKLGACLELAEWPGRTEALEQILWREADCVTVTGRDETVEAIRRQLPPGARLIAHGHKVSFAFVAREELNGRAARQAAARAAADVAAWDQLGCLSPQVIYVERDGGVSPENFAGLLAAELETREAVEPRGAIDLETAAAIASRRRFYEVRAANLTGTRLWASPGNTAWTVVYEDEPRFQNSCQHRFIYVKGVADLTAALEGADMVKGKVSTLGLAASPPRLREFAEQAARWGVTRVCPLGQMQNPPLGWHHDGRPALGDLVAWTDWEEAT